MKNTNKFELNLETLSKVNGGHFASDADFNKAVEFMNSIDGSPETDAAADLFFEFACDKGTHTFEDFMQELKDRGIYG